VYRILAILIVAALIAWSVLDTGADTVSKARHSRAELLANI